MHSTNYRATLITVAPDTKATTSIVPNKAGTIAALQYELVANAPRKHTSDDVLFLVYSRRRGLRPTQKARTDFFSKPQACLRSPLARSYGFGILHDDTGRIELVPMDSQDYRELIGNPEIKKVPAMRKSRAGA